MKIRSSGNILLKWVSIQSKGLNKVSYAKKYPQAKPQLECIYLSMFVITIAEIKRTEVIRQPIPIAILKGVTNLSKVDITLQED